MLACLTANDGGLGEFSPDTLEFRTRSELTIIGTDIPLYRSDWEYREIPLSRFLIDHNLVQPVRSGNPRWESVFHWNEGWRDGFGPMRNVLKPAGQRLAWMESHTDYARVYYTELFRLLRSNDYRERVIAGPFAHLVLTAEDVDTLRKQAAELRKECHLEPRPLAMTESSAN